MSLSRLYSRLRGKPHCKPVCFFLKLVLVIVLTYVIRNTLRFHSGFHTYTLGLNEHLDSDPLHLQYLRHLSEKILKYKPSARNCQIPKLKKQHIPGDFHGRTENKTVSCRRVPPLERSCDIAKALFQHKAKNTCSHQQTIIICSFKGVTKELVCDPTGCKGLFVGYRDVETGELRWSQAIPADSLRTNIIKLLKTSHNGFCYIKCEKENLEIEYSKDDHFEKSKELDNVQLLILPPTLNNTKKAKKAVPFINVNFIFIDSVSRHHFFRSMPETIKFFEEVNSGNETVVFDFELLQAIRSRTFETLNSLFAGYVPQTDRIFARYEMPPEPLKIEGIFRLFQDADYETLWMEDLCFEWEWGISKDLLVYDKTLTTAETWAKLKKAFRRVGIGSFGMSSAHCEILSRNGVKDHFHGPDSVCFNGRHQHEYMLEYLQAYQETMEAASRPYLTLSETNVGHEDTGTRLQTLDTDLEKYLRFSAKDEKTLTIIFSDHGNAYGKFVEKSQEARVEMFQPAMFIIVPKTVARYLGDGKMEALAVNQHRLTSHLDLHYAIRSFVSKTNHIPHVNRQYQVSPDGLFANISVERHCANVPQIAPNYCICEGGESRVENNSINVLFAHFAVGSMNNVIQSQFLATHPQARTGFGRCVRLELAVFQHVRKALNLVHKITMTMDLLFETADRKPHADFHRYEVFVVSVQSEPDGRNMQLVKFDRLTPYSKYSVCADHGVHLQLCICDVTKPKTRVHHIPLSTSSILTKSDILMTANVGSIEKSHQCLFRINQENEHGVAMSLINVCSSVLMHVKLDVSVVNINLSADPQVQLYLKPGEIRFLFVGLSSDVMWDFSLTVEVTSTKWP